jgi:hypothetical protein
MYFWLERRDDGLFEESSPEKIGVMLGSKPEMPLRAQQLLFCNFTVD